jgi:hypothetical protein
VTIGVFRNSSSFVNIIFVTTHNHIYNYHSVEHLDSSMIVSEWAGHNYTMLPMLNNDFDLGELLGGQGSSSWYAPPPP